MATYIAKRAGLTPGRIWFGAGNAINAKITAQQRRNYRHELKRFLVFDDFHKRQPEGLIAEGKHVNLASGDITSAGQTCLGTCAKTNEDVFVVEVAAPGRGWFEPKPFLSRNVSAGFCVEGRFLGQKRPFLALVGVGCSFFDLRPAAKTGMHLAEPAAA